jgi:tetratricopeptide (TPR) repeat protein
VGLLLALSAAVVWLQVYRERHFRTIGPVQQMLYVQSPAAVKRLSLSYDAVLSDIYWIRVVQYYGSIRLSANADKRYPLLYPLLDLTTSLDPQFRVAYRFGAFFLSEGAPGGADRPDLAIRLLEKAITANPDRWEYPYDVGFVYYRRGDYPRAAEWFQRASEVPGAVNWLKPLAAVTLATGGDIESSRRLWQNLQTEEDADWLRGIATHRLQQLDAIETIGHLEALAAAFAGRHGGPPASWDALIRDRILRDVPRDPAGHPYVIHQSGTVSVSEASPLWPLPTERVP